MKSCLLVVLCASLVFGQPFIINTYYANSNCGSTPYSIEIDNSTFCTITSSPGTCITTTSYSYTQACVASVSAANIQFPAGSWANIGYPIYDLTCTGLPARTVITTPACSIYNDINYCANNYLYEFTYSGAQCTGTQNGGIYELVTPTCKQLGSNPPEGYKETCNENDVLAAYGAAPVSCNVGDMECVSSTQFSTCVYLDAYLNTGFSATQSCAPGTSCHSAGAQIACY